MAFSEGISQYITEDGQWLRLLTSRKYSGCPCIFLDRDGVIIEERHYLSDPDGVVLIPGAAELIRGARAGGWAIVVVSNQSGIGRGKFGWGEHFAVETRMIELLSDQGAELDLLLACPNYPSGLGRYGSGDHTWRKPGAGMIVAAAGILDIRLTNSVLVGDKASDIEAARNAGLPYGIHVMTGHGKEEDDIFRLRQLDFRVDQVASIKEAASLILGAKKRGDIPKK